MDAHWSPSGCHELTGLAIGNDGSIDAVQRLSPGDMTCATRSRNTSTSGRITAEIIQLFHPGYYQLRLFVDGAARVPYYVIDESLCQPTVFERCVSDGGLVVLMQPTRAGTVELHVFDAFCSRHTHLSTSSLGIGLMTGEQEFSISIGGLPGEKHYIGLHVCNSDETHVIGVSPDLIFSPVKLAVSAVHSDLHQQIEIVIGDRPACLMISPHRGACTAIECFDCETGQQQWQITSQPGEATFGRMVALSGGKFAVARGRQVQVYGIDGVMLWDVRDLLHDYGDSFLFSPNEHFVAGIACNEGYTVFPPVKLHRQTVLALIVATRRLRRRRLPAELYWLLWEEFFNCCS